MANVDVKQVREWNRELDGVEVTYGIRPEHFDLDISKGFAFDVEVVEPTGSETQIFGKLGGFDLTVVVKSRYEISPGERMSIKPLGDKAHVFDAETGYRL